MEKEDRAKIDGCLDEMVRLIDMESIWPRMFVNQIFRRDDVSVPKWQNVLKDPETKRDILMKIKTRGPNAYKSLVKCLRETQQEHLIALLENPRTGLPINTTSNATSRQPSANNNAANHQSSTNNAASYQSSANNAASYQPSTNNAASYQSSANNAASYQPSTNNAASYQSSANNNVPWCQDEELAYNPIEAREVLKINVKKSTKFMEIDGEVLYPMKSNPRGLVLIITIIKYISSDRNRESAQHDHDNLIELFHQMGFDVIHRTDLSADEIREVVKEFSQNKKLRHVDSCFVIISAHGDSTEDEKNNRLESVIHGTDHTGVKPTPHKEIKCRDIIHFFSAEKCLDMAGKPKVFIFQACRGKNKQKALSYQSSHQRNNNILIDFDIEGFGEDLPKQRASSHSIRNYDDMIVCHSTLPNHVSFRDGEYGSWFIQILCEVFMKRAHRVHLLKLFQTIDERLKTIRTSDFGCQTATTKVSGFNKDLYINPGYFE